MLVTCYVQEQKKKTSPSQQTQSFAESFGLRVIHVYANVRDYSEKACSKLIENLRRNNKLRIWDLHFTSRFCGHQV
jgi:hypothetical protein